MSDDRAEQRIERAIGELGKDLAPPAGWEGRVLASGAAPAAAPAARRVKWWWIAAPALAAAAVIAIVLWSRGGGAGKPTAPQLAVAIQRGDHVMRSTDATVGDELQATAGGGAAQRALWIYRDDTLVAACPGDARCAAAAGGGWRAAVRLDAIGRYRVVYVMSARAITPPGGRYDQDVAGALGAGATQRTEIVDVR